MVIYLYCMHVPYWSTGGSNSWGTLNEIVSLELKWKSSKKKKKNFHANLWNFHLWITTINIFMGYHSIFTWGFDNVQIRSQLDDAIASECPYCGDLMIREISLPFIVPEEVQEVSSWEIKPHNPGSQPQRSLSLSAWSNNAHVGNSCLHKRYWLFSFQFTLRTEYLWFLVCFAKHTSFTYLIKLSNCGRHACFISFFILCYKMTCYLDNTIDTSRIRFL